MVYSSRVVLPDRMASSGLFGSALSMPFLQLSAAERDVLSA